VQILKEVDEEPQYLLFLGSRNSRVGHHPCEIPDRAHHAPARGTELGIVTWFGERDMT
jgi:hypothetical protein